MWCACIVEFFNIQHFNPFYLGPFDEWMKSSSKPYQINTCIISYWITPIVFISALSFFSLLVVNEIIIDDKPIDLNNKISPFYSLNQLDQLDINWLTVQNNIVCLLAIMVSFLFWPVIQLFWSIFLFCFTRNRYLNWWWWLSLLRLSSFCWSLIRFKLNNLFVINVAFLIFSNDSGIFAKKSIL